MGSKKYPLGALIDVRRDQADAATRDLGSAIRIRESKEAERSAAERAAGEHAAQVAETQRAERAELAQGALRAVDLMRQDAWQLQRDREEAELAEKQRRATTAEAEAHRDESTARAGVAQKLGELKAVERDRERFTEEQKKLAQAKEEEAAEEVWRPR